MAGSKHKTHKGEHSRKCRCTKCGVYHALLAFRRTRERGRLDICRSCELVPCEACAATLSRGNSTISDIRSYFNSAGAKHITCLVCKGYRCTKCEAVYQRLSAFRWTKGRHVDVCRKCELVPCATCGGMLPRGNFTEGDIYNYFANATHITCLVCREHQEARRQRLQELMEQSKRKACTCKRPHAHSRGCPLRVKCAGDRPYPGCDVMSRADSDWLLEHRKKHRYRLVTMRSFETGRFLSVTDTASHA